MSVRNELRAQIFDAKNRVPAKEIISFMGSEVEIRQPLIADIIEMSQSDKNQNLVEMLIGYVYVPGTDEKVFEEADRDSLAQFPFNSDLAAFTDAIEKLTDIDLKADEGN